MGVFARSSSDPPAIFQLIFVKFEAHGRKLKKKLYVMNARGGKNKNTQDMSTGAAACAFNAVHVQPIDSSGSMFALQYYCSYSQPCLAC